MILIVKIEGMMHDFEKCNQKRGMNERDVGDYFEIPIVKYEYLDHPADIQLHAWGDSVEECFEQVAMAMFAYMTDIETVDIQTTETIEAEGHDLESLLYNFLNEFLYYFSAENFFIARKVKIVELEIPHILKNGDLKDGTNSELNQGDSSPTFKVIAKGFGESFDISKHPQGTEIKAITYSCLQITPKEKGGYECYVIVDI